MLGRHRAAAALLSVGLVLPSAAAYAAPLGDDAEGPAGDASGVVVAQAEVRPQVAPAPAPVLQPVTSGLAVDPGAVRAAIGDDVDSEWLGKATHIGVTVRDVTSGEVLVNGNVERPLTPASTTKLLAAAAIVTSLPLDEPFRTRVVAGAEPDQIVLVAGGDMMLAAGAGDPDLVEGHAGLGDLADQTARALREQGLGVDGQQVRLRLDTTYAAGPIRPQGWSDYWLNEGYTGPITMLGLVEHRAVPYDPAPRDPAQETAMAFRRALTERGIDVGGGPETEVPREVAPAEAAVLAEVDSAPARDVLSEAMSSSDNAMVEQLARQAAVADGVSADPAAVRDWVVEQVGTAYGIDMTGVRLSDVSGLSDGSQIPVRVLGDLLVSGADGSHPDLQQVLGELPIAGYTGTLWDRFHLDRHAPAVGVARAKTGSLPTVTSLAGLVVTRDGRLLAYAIIADAVGRDGAFLEARSVVDTIVAELAACGC
ncbi:D-alanyl-D-alanine carboxypeptidase/D-alanyl-D-alanine-endopeptidase [Ornithinimicrobium cavernae]|uniref:D-alanyl-D-alanine carboxypeptidase/D-alanyl-D-alanine endopeptidase n=1 Tax=Ornithinimicrobium cavernae TaxID=2666047 RepID=UPI000D6858CE|nr:D-alanyl-D-alanine carboxypeptidase/D-alanyl-D-alanine-endopeptidase [Ornithinimicrobium cavernae]